MGLGEGGGGRRYGEEGEMLAEVAVGRWGAGRGGAGGCGGWGVGWGAGRRTYRQVTLYECNYSVASKKPASGLSFFSLFFSFFFSFYFFLLVLSSSPFFLIRLRRTLFAFNQSDARFAELGAGAVTMNQPQPESLNLESEVFS